MLKPTQGRVVAKPIDLQEQSLIVSLGMARYREYILGTITAIPEGDTGEAGVLVGEVIAWRKFTGIKAELDGEDIVILTQDEILGVVTS